LGRHNHQSDQGSGSRRAWGELMGTLEIQVTDMQITPGSDAKITVR